MRVAAASHWDVRQRRAQVPNWHVCPAPARPQGAFTLALLQSCSQLLSALHTLTVRQQKAGAIGWE